MSKAGKPRRFRAGLCCLVLWLGPACSPHQVTPWEREMAAGAGALQQARYAEAETSFRAALKEAEGFGPQDPRLATSLINLGEVSQAQSRFAEAESLYKRAYTTLLKGVKRVGDPFTAPNLNTIVTFGEIVGRLEYDLAALYQVQGRYKEAEPHYKTWLALYGERLSPQDPHLAIALTNLGLLYQRQGRYSEAEPLYKRALANWEKVLGTEDRNVAVGLTNLAVLYQLQGRYNEADPLYKRALLIWEKAQRPEDHDWAASLEHYAALLRLTHRETEAAELEGRAKAIGAKGP